MKVMMKTIGNVLVLILMAVICTTEAGDKDFYNKASEILCKNDGKSITDAQIANIKTNCKVPDIKKGDPISKCTKKDKLTDRQQLQAFCDPKVMACVNEPQNMPTTPAGSATISPQIIEKLQNDLLDCIKKETGSSK